MTHKLVLVSDMHLSRERPYFQFNWEMFLEKIRHDTPDLVLIGGDMALNAPSNPADLAFARAQFDRLPCPWVAVPGNHDVGNNPPPASVVDDRGETIISDDSVRRYRDTIGPDYWTRDIGRWLLVGLNGHLCGSGLAAEAEQAAFLDATMKAAGDRPVAFFFHKPVFNDALTETRIHQSFWYPDARALIGEHLRSGQVKLVLTGHIHESRDETVDGVRYVWIPPLAFVTDMVGDWRPAFRGRRRVGWLSLELGDNAVVTRHEPDELLNIDITNWMRSGSIHFYESFTGKRDFVGLPQTAA